jgi:hypothetical protein
MSLKTFMQDAREKRRVAQLKNEAGQTVGNARSANLRMFGIPVALGFAFLLLSLAGIAQPVQAVDINLTAITDTINAFIEVIDPITNLVIAIVPLWFVISIVGFIMGLLAAILIMVKKGMHF